MSASLPPARLLWDQGGLWSLMTLRACRDLGLAIASISAASVAAGGLRGARLLVVPGGWSGRKVQALGRPGAQALRAFVEGGGQYLGFCGGAGLALSVPDGLGLVPLGRAAGGQRLPSLSGPLWVRPGPLADGHPLWQGLKHPSPLHVWWPAQFATPRAPGLEVLAVYGPPAPGLCSSDLCVDQVDPEAWPELEARYGLRLKPEGLEGRPAVLQARLGRGSLLLSYPHLDTPGDAPGGQALANLWRAWLPDLPPASSPQPESPAPAWAASMASQAQSLWQQGLDLGLWRPRHPEMPLWRRGARGLEFWGLLRLCQALAQAAAGREVEPSLPGELEAALAPVWRRGPSVLAAQAARLAGQDPPEEEGAHLERAWFPASRRLVGPLARGLEQLELALLRLEVGAL